MVVRPVTFPPGCERLATSPDRIGSDTLVIHNRDSACGVLSRERGRRIDGEDNVNPGTDDLVGKNFQPIARIVAELPENYQVVALDVANVTQSLPKSLQGGRLS